MSALRPRHHGTSDPSASARASVAGSGTADRDAATRLQCEAIGRFAGSIAHDLNELLTAICSYAFLLREDVGEDAVARESLDGIAAATERGSRLARQLLALDARRAARPAPVDVGCMLAVALSSVEAHGREITVERPTSDALGWVEGDAAELDRAVGAVLHNAVEAMPFGGTLTLGGRMVEAPIAPGAGGAVLPGRYVCIEVADTGIGMNDETRHRIFEPLFTTKERRVNAGLGLTIAQRIVRQHGGFITVESRPGAGTRVRLCLPQATHPRPTPTMYHAADPDVASETILLVDDDRVLREVLARALRRLGFHVLDCAEGESAVQVAADHQGRIDLLLIDTVMPRLSGPAAARRILELRPRLPVVLMSGYSEDVLDGHITLDTNASFIAKPFRAVDLAQRVREILDGTPQQALDS